MESEIKKNDGKKMKIVVISVVIILIVVAAVITAVGFSKNNNLYKSSRSDISYESPMMGSSGMGMADSFSVAERPTAGSKEIVYDSMQFPESENGASQISKDKKIIKNGNLELTVDRVSDAQEKISEISKKNGGDIFSSNINQTKANIKSGFVVIRIPVANFEKAFEELKKIATLVVSESTSGQDVTQEYQDLETQIKNKQAEEQSYVRILDQAQKIEDILSVTRQLSRVRGEIERLQGQIKYLASQTDMSTISMHITEDQDVTIADSWRPLQVAKDAINSLVKSSQGFINLLIVLIITVIPIAILYLLVIFVLFLIGRKIYQKARKKKEEKVRIEADKQ